MTPRRRYYRRRRRPAYPRSSARCRLCGRVLTNPTSIRRGYGPSCWNKINARALRNPIYPYHSISVSTSRKSTSFSKRTSATNIILKSITSGLVEGAVIYGVSAVFPPVGSILIPSYEFYDYAKAGVAIFNIINQLSQSKPGKGTVRKRSIINLAESIADIASSPHAEKTAKTIVDSIKDKEFISNISKRTGVEKEIYSNMLFGSISNGISNGVGGLSSYSFSTALGV